MLELNEVAGCLEEGLEGELALYRAGRRAMFKFDRVFGMESNQAQVYEDTKALIRSVLDGMHLLKITSSCHKHRRCKSVI